MNRRELMIGALAAGTALSSGAVVAQPSGKTAAESFLTSPNALPS